MKRFDLDVGKGRARARFREFIARRIFDRKKKRILCFPGEYGLEIDQVYRKLGFLDENIFGVERDANAARRIRANYPKINLFEGELQDFVNQYEGGPFDIVSLDYCGKLASDKIKPIAILKLRELLAERAIVGINVFAGREKTEDQSMMRTTYMKILSEHQPDLKGKFMHPVDMVDKFNELISEANTAELSEARSDTLTHTVINQLSYIIPTLTACMLLRLTKTKGYGVAITADSEVRVNDDGTLSISNAVINGKDVSGIAPGTPNKPELDESPLYVSQTVKHEAIMEVNELLEEKGIPSFLPKVLQYHFGRTMVMQFFDAAGAPHLPIALERYSYISESGKRMVSDYIEFHDFHDKLARCKLSIVPQLNKETGEHRWRLHPDSEQFQSIGAYRDWVMTHTVKWYAENIAIYSKTEPHTWPKRIDLGGGEAIKINEQKIHGHVIALIKKGRTPEQIASKYPMLGIGKIRAIKAHVTMGTYGKK